MTLEAEVRKIITEFEQKEPKANRLIKGLLAFRELANFDIVANYVALDKKNDIKNGLVVFNYSCPSLKRIVLDYSEGQINQAETLYKITKLRSKTEALFRSRGYDTQVEKDWFTLTQEEINLASRGPINPDYAKRLEEVRKALAAYH